MVLFGLLAALALSACSGTTQIDLNLDPTSGSGNIVITGDEDGAEAETADTQVGNTDMSQVVLFGVVIALLLGTVAIVVASSRRPAGE